MEHFDGVPPCRTASNSKSTAPKLICGPRSSETQRTFNSYSSDSSFRSVELWCAASNKISRTRLIKITLFPNFVRKFGVLHIKYIICAYI